MGSISWSEWALDEILVGYSHKFYALTLAHFDCRSNNLSVFGVCVSLLIAYTALSRTKDTRTQGSRFYTDTSFISLCSMSSVDVFCSNDF